jgi:hypothetical protein
VEEDKQQKMLSDQFRRGFTTSGKGAAAGVLNITSLKKFVVRAATGLSQGAISEDIRRHAIDGS